MILAPHELERVRAQLARYEWYREILARYRQRVDELILRSPAIPLVKGRAFYESCPADHAMLIFDPYRPTLHRCPKCGREWHGEEYDLAWVRQFQDWLAKRLVEAGILYALEGDERHARLVRDSLRHFIRHYRDYPLANNLLGPTRLFQSTFLEAFWLVDIVAAYDLTRGSSVFSHEDHAGVRGLLYESAETVMGFDEGVSNRQAFNNAGVGAVALLYEDEPLLGHVLAGPHGFAFHMRESLLEDGIWYEGETYHFATLDHTLNLAEMARHRGIDLYHGTSGYGSLRPMFDGPLKVMLPDLTFPSRKDSWFGRGIGYHRNVYELGYARYGDERYGGLLAHAYAGGANRSDLSWRSFLYLEPELPEVSVSRLRPRSNEPMRGSGVAVLRAEEGSSYAAVEYGHYGGGHGHPDRLHLTLFADGVHWLLDPGTGWYHVEELGWYRSTLAHNTVMVGGNNQAQSEGSLTAFGRAGGLSVARAKVEGIYPGVTALRTICLANGFVLELVEVERKTGADESEPVDLTFSLRGDLTLTGHREPLSGPLSPRGGHPFLAEPARLHPPGRGVLEGWAEQDGRRLRLLHQGGGEYYVGTGPGIPLHEERPMRVVISRSGRPQPRYLSAWLWGESSPEATMSADGVLTVGHERITLHSGRGAGVAVVCEATAEGQGRPLRVAWFGLSRVESEVATVECDHPLEAAALVWEGRRLTADVPSEFGRIRVSGPGADVETVAGLPAGASWRLEEGELILTQFAPEALWLQEPATVEVAAGMESRLRFVVARYGNGSPESPTVTVPSGWEAGPIELAGRSGPLEYWELSLRAPVRPGGHERLELATERTRLETAVNVREPVGVDWRVSSEFGRPSLDLLVSEEAGLEGSLWGELNAPWAVSAPRPFSLSLTAHGRESISLPLPLSPRPPTARETEGRMGGVPAIQGPGFDEGGDNTGRLAGGNAGEYHIACLVRRDGFSGLGRFSLPLTWARRRRGEQDAAPTVAVGGIRIDRPEQAYWAEEPWPGPHGASARALLEWDEHGLYLHCRVFDDVLVADANDEDLYENDSLQLYLDFRPSEGQDSSFSPGVAAFIFAPDSRLERVRIEPIAGSRELANRGLAAPWFTMEGVSAAVAPEPGGYRLEAFMPFRSLGIEPLAAGDVFRADLSLSDNDGTWYRTNQLVWSGARGYRRCYLRWGYLDPAGYGWVIVSDD